MKNNIQILLGIILGVIAIPNIPQANTKKEVCEYRWIVIKRCHNGRCDITPRKELVCTDEKERQEIREDVFNFLNVLP